MIITVGHAKGGVGKSTLTYNLAVSFQQEGYKVQIIEADPSIRTCSRWSNAREEYTDKDPVITVRKDGVLGATLREADSQYDMVLVDTAGKDSKELRSAMTVTDVLIIPTSPEQADVEATYDFFELVDMVKEINENLQVVTVINKAPTHAFNKDIDEAKEFFSQIPSPNMKVADAVIHRRSAFHRTSSDGLSVVESRDSKAKAEIQLLAQEILKIQEAPK